MATAKRTVATPQNSGLAQGLLLTLLVLPSILPGGFANALCGAEFLYPFPTQGLRFYNQDTVNVTYTSIFKDPTLYCWCGPTSGDKKQS
jgi:hypothetical protein